MGVGVGIGDEENSWCPSEGWRIEEALNSYNMIVNA
jgi:hypothetical protein